MAEKIADKLSAEEMLKWKHLIQSHLKIKKYKKIAVLQNDIMVVDFGMKPAYLYDIGSPSKDELFFLVRNLYKNGLVHHPLCVLSLADDLLIVNPDTMKRHISNGISPILQTRMVDVSGHLTSPIIMSEELISEKADIRDTIDRLPLTCTDVCSVSVDPPPNCNVSSLFGLLLGYPVVYWYRTGDSETYTNCLGMQDLINFRVIGSENETSNHMLYSFSVPECLREQLYVEVQQWFENIKSNTAWNKLYRTLEMTEDTICLPIVVI